MMKIHELDGTHRGKHFATFETGVSQLWINSDVVDARWEIGEIETGRSRVFHSYFVKIILADKEYLGTHEHSLRSALRNAAEACERGGLQPPWIGLDEEFRETGLSWNTGWGYIGSAAIHMMEPSVDVPSRPNC